MARHAADVHSISMGRYRAACSSCRWYGPIRDQRYRAQADAEQHVGSPTVQYSENGA